MNPLVKLGRALVKGMEGAYRGAAAGWSDWGHVFPVSFGNGYQDGLNLYNNRSGPVPAAYAAVMATAKSIALCRAQHMVMQPDGSHKPSRTSPAARMFRSPNNYETWAQFMTNALAMMLFEGNAYVQLVRDDRYAISAMHLLPYHHCRPWVAAETGDVFYLVGQNIMNPTEANYMAPARDILHLRVYTPRHPLIGESPIVAAALAVGVNVAISVNQQAFYTNMSRPSGVLMTDAQLRQTDVEELRKRFEDQSKQWNAGRLPILSHGLKYEGMAISSQDAELIQAQRLTIEDIARVYGVPLPVIGDLTHATLNNTESTINFWLATGLGYFIELVEESLDDAFNLGIDDYIEFDTAALLRMDFQQQVDGLSKAVQGGLITPNEARQVLDFTPVDGGDDLYLQQQMISLSMLNDLHEAEIESKLRPPPAPTPPPGAPAPEDGTSDTPTPTPAPTEVNPALPDLSRALADLESKLVSEIQKAREPVPVPDSEPDLDEQVAAMLARNGWQ